MAVAARVVVLAAGARATTGLSARQVAFGARTGTGVWRNVHLSTTTVNVVTVPGLDPDLPLAERMAQLGGPALAEALAGLDLGSLPMVLGVPALAAYPDLAFEPRKLLNELVDASGMDIDRGRSTVVTGEHAAGALALARGLDILSSTSDARAVVVGGVDSRLAEPLLEALVQSGRLAPSTYLGRARSDPGGLLPGEGAAFVVLGREGAGAIAQPPLARVGKIIVRILAEGAALSDTVAEALGEALGPADKVWLLSDVNGEAKQAELWTEGLRALQVARGSGRIEMLHETPALTLGDTGAATAPLAIAIAAVSLASGAAIVEPAIVAVRAEDGMTGAIVVESAGPPPARSGGRAQGRLGLGRVARAASRDLDGLAAELRAAAHRIPRGRRAGVLTSMGALARALQELEDAEVSGRILASLDAAAAAAEGLGAAARACKKSFSRRGHAPEPVLDKLEHHGRRVGEELGKRREAAMFADDPADESRRPVAAAAFVASRASPSRLGIPFGAGPMPAFSVDADDDLEDDEDAPSQGQERAADAGVPKSEIEAAPETERPGASSPMSEFAEESLDAISLLWRQREPPHGAVWSARLEETDARILAELDLIHALACPSPSAEASDARVDVVSMLRTADDPLDPGLAFARTLVLASCADERLVRAAGAKARGAPPPLTRPYADALALGSSPHLDDIAAELVLDPSPTAVRIGLEVMGRRGVVSLGAAAAHLYAADAGVRALAARALGRCGAQAGAVLALETRLSIEIDTGVVAAIVEALLRQRAPHVHAHLARAFADAEGAAKVEIARLAAAAARGQEAAALVATASTPAELEVLGWFGRATAVGRLIDALGSIEPDIRRAAARSLVRILGVVPEASPRGLGVARAPLTAVDDGRLVADAAAVRAYWNEHGAAFGTGTKYRFGAPWSPAQSLAELTSAALPSDRRMAELEVAIGGPPGLALPDLSDWVGRQLAAARLGGAR
jgi:hypothetical protein